MFVFSVHRRQIKMAILVLCIAVVAVAFVLVSKEGVQAAKEAQMNVRAFSGFSTASASGSFSANW